MAYEIDYLPVGEGDKAGDCIAIRFWNPVIGIASQKVIVIDGGYKDSGEAVVNCIKNFYKTNTIDLVISTHPDKDHASGLVVVLEEMDVRELIMHKPWEHASDIKREFINGRLTVSGIKEDLEESLMYASELEAIADRKNIPISEPFSGMQRLNGVMHVLGPNLQYYQDLLPQFKGTPEAKNPLSALGMVVKKIGEEAIQIIQDTMHLNHLDDEDSTSPENNSSAIILFHIDGHKILFTGDAGKRAIEQAILYAQSQNISLTDLEIFDVPHHGSKRNLGKTAMELINAKTAYISAPINSNKHPASKVTNHLFKKGMGVFATQGRHICHFSGTTMRPGWGPISPIPFKNEIEL